MASVSEHTSDSCETGYLFSHSAAFLQELFVLIVQLDSLEVKEDKIYQLEIITKTI